MSRRQGFTLLEILIAIVLGLMLLLIAVPSVSGMFRERKVRETFQKFDEFVRSAQTLAVTERRTHVMIWDEAGIELVPLDPTAPELAEDSAASAPAAEPEAGAETAASFFPFTEGTWSLQRPAALVKKPIWEWPFWRSGVCEPAIVQFESEAGSWTAEYTGLSARGRITAMEVK